MNTLILRNLQSPGDVVMMTAALRDLHLSCPGRFQTDVQTSCPALWENNPYLTPLDQHDSNVRLIDCGYPLIHKSNQLPYHFVHGFARHLGEQLGVSIEPTAFKGDIHLAEGEVNGTVFGDEAPLLRNAYPYPLGTKDSASDAFRCLGSSRCEEAQVDASEGDHGLLTSVAAGAGLPLWVVSAGGKQDFTTKWWSTKRYQQVVDYFRGRIQFVQVGSGGHWHPELDGVIDLRAKTTLRQLIRLVYHADGVLSPVSLLMHLSAAVPTREEFKSGADKLQTCSSRPCVVIAGGREPVHWEAYPTHQFIHTVGLLPCCSHGGCWRSRTAPRGDGSEHDHPRRLCVDVVNSLPRCMDMITAEEVIRRIEMYLAARKATASPTERGTSSGAVPSFFSDRNEARIPPTEKLPALQAGHLTMETAPKAMERFIAGLPEYAGGFAGRGIVICGGGVKYFTCAWVCIHMLRKLGCELPIELWHIGPRECDAAMRGLVEPLGVQCVDASDMRLKHRTRILSGWSLKPYAVLHSRFREVLFLDADNVPVVNPETLFAHESFQRTGAVFWPDYGWLKPKASAWLACGLAPLDESDFESGQIVVDKQRCWRELNLTVWMNGYSDFFYQHMHGDKDTFHLAWRKFGTDYAMPGTPVKSLEGCVMCQHDFDGNRLFQHRNQDKWSLSGGNRRIGDFLYEEECRGFLEDLRRQWGGQIESVRSDKKALEKPHVSSATTVSEAVPQQGGRRHVEAFPIILAVMISCVERDELRAQTLGNLAATDWGGQRVHVQLDASTAVRKQERQEETSRAALQTMLQAKLDYILFLEDDLQFNRHLLWNLRHWAPLQRGEVTLAGLYAPNIGWFQRSQEEHWFIADPNTIYGSQAFLVSREAAAYMVEHWREVEGMQDIKMSRLAAKIGKPIYYHSPSLVQHVGQASVWGGSFHQSADFDADWRKLASVPA